MAERVRRPGGTSVPNEPSHQDATSFWHDIRQALATISALSMAAEIDVEQKGEAIRRLALIREEVRRILEMCDELGGSGPSNADESIPLHELVGPLLEAPAAVRGVHLELHLHPAWVSGDPVGLRRVVSNLAENACRAAGADGSVVVSVGTRDGEVVLEVGDSGPGFDRGRLGSDHLGLAIVESVTLSHGGTLAFERSEAGGALVRVVLPAADDRQRAPGGPARVSRREARSTAMVGGDEGGDS